MSLSKALEKLAKQMNGTADTRALRKIEKALKELGKEDLAVGLFDPKEATKGASHEYGTKTIPQRSFMRSTLSKDNKEFVKTIGKATGGLFLNRKTPENLLKDVGDTAVAEIRKTMDAGIRPLKADGSTATLKETGDMYRALEWKIR